MYRDHNSTRGRSVHAAKAWTLGIGQQPVRSERGTDLGAVELVNRRIVFRRMPRDLQTDGMLD